MSFVTGADATRLRELVNKQALDARGNPLPWPSERSDGSLIVGSIGTTSIQDTRERGVDIVYDTDGLPSIYIDIAINNGRSRLTGAERTELSAILTREQEVR